MDRLENLRSSVKKLHDILKFKFDEVSQKVTLFLKPRTSARLSPPLARLLGFDMTDIPYGRNKGSRLSDLAQGFSSLYVYFNVVQPTVVGDSFVPLLKIVPVEGKTGHTVTRTYQNIQYLPVQANNFETVEIQIAKDTGELVPFERGKRFTFARTVVYKYMYWGPLSQHSIPTHHGGPKYCCNGAAVEQYYRNQVGTGLPVFRGNRVQRGHGLGNMFKGLLKSVVPLVKSGAKSLGKQALSTGLDITRDVLSGQNFKDAARQIERDGNRNVTESAE